MSATVSTSTPTTHKLMPRMSATLPETFMDSCREERDAPFPIVTGSETIQTHKACRRGGSARCLAGTTLSRPSTSFPLYDTLFNSFTSRDTS